MQRFKNKERTLISSVCLAATVSLVCYTALSVICCILLFLGKNPTANIKIMSLIAFLLSGALCGIITSRVIKERPIIISASGGALFCASLLILSQITGGSLLPTLMNILCYMLCILLFSYLGSVKVSKKARRFHKKRV